MKQSKAIIRACQVLRWRVRFRNASLTLPKAEPGLTDTDRIRAAAHLYTESWIVPLLDAIETGNTRMLREWCEREDGDEIT